MENLDNNQNIQSEWQLFRHLLTYGSKDLTEYELYKACVPDALNGVLHKEAINLSLNFQALLNIRIHIYQQHYRQGLHLLKILSTRELNSLQLGDLHLLTAAILHENGHIKWAHHYLAKAEDFFLKSPDKHKYLRSIINKQISIKTSSEQIKSYLIGALYFLKQDALRKKYFDLCGCIDKSLSCEFISIGNFEGSLTAAQSAHDYFLLDGCSIDGNMALILKSIALYCLGQKSEAIKIRSALPESHGKYKPLLLVFDQLTQGQKPNLKREHPLYGTPWPISQFRKNSVVGIAHSRLIKGPVSREELIKVIWGNEAIDPSYVTRLHTLITSLRSKYHLVIEFDGVHYSLISSQSQSGVNSAG